jgi:hypothetical protein
MLFIRDYVNKAGNPAERKKEGKETMITRENEEYTIGGSKTTGGAVSYHILWLDTGARTCGYLTKEAAIKDADCICHKTELRKTSRVG